jgi:hypothetical protein
MSIRVMKLVLFALVLLSSAVSSNCQVITYLDNECKILIKLNYFQDIYILQQLIFSIVRM